MLTLSSVTDSLLSLFFPAHCIGCGKVLSDRQEWICIHCRATMPSTYFHLKADNPMAEKIKSLCPKVENAAAQFFYIHKGKWREVIHEIKYRHSWHSAYKMGYWYGCELLESPLYQDIDLIVPVPLHRSRRLTRRYNQSEKIAEGMARAMGAKVNRTALKRSRNNPSQVTRSKEQRWQNVDGIFSLGNSTALEGRHILLVDDVFTTGATLVSCIETLEKGTPSSRVSVATLAVSRNEIIGRAI